MMNRAIRYTRGKRLMRYGGVLGALVAVGLMFGGCSEKRDDPVGPDAHPDVWTNAESDDFHGVRVAQNGNTLCLECHTLTAPDGSSDEIIALSCASSAGCHGTADDTATLNCESCHSGLGAVHQAHFDAEQDNCLACHWDKSISLFRHINSPIRPVFVVDSLHMNAKFEVELNSDVGGAYDSTTSSCSGSYCHRSGTPTWIAKTLDCESCHTKAALSDLHAEHFGEMAGDCSVCHSATATDSTAIRSNRAHVNFDVDVVFATGISGMFDETANTCANTYCHGSGVTTTAWDNATALDCQGCHAYDQLPDSHPKHLEFSDDCSLCHASVASNNSEIAAPALHANQTVDVELNSVASGTYRADSKKCANTNCHGQELLSPAWATAPVLDCNTCHPITLLPDAHQAHFTQMTVDCETCHQSAPDNSRHLNFTVDVRLSDGGTFNAEETCSSTSCHGPTTTPTWDGGTDLVCADCHVVDGPVSPVSPGASLRGLHGKHFDVIGNDCSLCHANTAASADVLSDPANHLNKVADVAFATQVGGTFSDVTHSCADTYCHIDGTPVWEDTLLGCESCHATDQLPANHADHFALTPAECETCHAVTASGSDALQSGTVTHVNFAVDVSFATGYDGTYVSGSETCQGSYCHFSFATPAWTGSDDFDCQSCHDDASLPAPHDTHLTATGGDCSVCHSATVSDATTISDPSKHTNLAVDVSFNGAVGGSYDAGANTCSDTYCHVSAAPTWQTTSLDCNSCHSNDSLPASHPAHFSTMQQNCETCHAATAQDSTAIANAANHVNFVTDVALAVSFGGTFDNGAMTCDNTYCHGTGVTTTAWDNPTDLDCESCHAFASLPDNHAVHLTKYGNECGICHANTAEGSSLVDRGEHADLENDVAIDDVYGGTYSSGTCSDSWCHGPRISGVSPAWDGITDLDCQGCHPTAQLTGGHNASTNHAGFGCQSCHSLVVSNATTIIDDALHVNNTVNVDLTWGDMAYDDVAQTCGSTSSCHSAGSKNWFTLE
jgi:predicted CxxxxCH...CXXCH cytochrome family protein